MPRNAFYDGSFLFHVQTNGYPTPHSHENWFEFLFVLSGKLLHVLNGTEEEIAPGTLVFIHSINVHSIHKLTDNAEYIACRVSDAHLSPCIDWISRKMKSKLLDSTLSFHVAQEKHDKIIQILNKIMTVDEAETHEFFRLLAWSFLEEIIFYRKKCIPIRTCIPDSLNSSNFWTIRTIFPCL